MKNPNYVLCCHLEVCESCELLHHGCSIYMLWGIQGVNRRIPARSSVAIAGSSDGASRVTARESLDGRQAWALYRHWRISVRWHGDHRAVIERRLPDLRSMACGFFPIHFGRWPPNRRSGIGRCPTGRRQMRKIGEASGGHRANFNCKLNLPDHRRMSAGWVLNRRITAGFLQDSSQGSPHSDPEIDFALLWRSYKGFKKNDDKKGLCPYYGELFNTVHDRKTAFAYTPCSIYNCKNAFNIDIAVHTYITIFIILIPFFDPLT